MASSPQKAEKRSMSRRSDSGRFFFSCCRPGIADQEDGGLIRSRSTPVEGRDAEGSVFAYIAFDDKGNKADVLQRIVPHRRACKGEVSIRPVKDGTSKRLVRATKAAFRDMSLVSKFGKKRIPKKTEVRNGQLCKKVDRILRLMSERSEEHSKSDSDVSSSFSSTSLTLTGSTSSLSPQSSSNSLDHGARKLLARRVSFNPSFYGQGKPPVQVRNLSSTANTPICLIVLAMAVLIFWGKVCAIVCTSVGLVFSLPSWVPQRASSDHKPVDSVEYKKRVIMEGLLRRQHELQRWSSS